MSHSAAQDTRPGVGPRDHSRRGHTLIELMIVVVMISIIAGIAIPRVNFTDLRLDANVRIVRSVLQQAWRSSIQKQHDVIVSFNTSAGTMRILEDVNNDGAASTGERISWRPLEEGVIFATPPAGVNGTVTAEVVGGGVRTISTFPSVVFRRNGSTSGDTEIYLNATGRSGTSWRALTVAQSTGRTDWFRRVNNTWRSGGN